MAEDVEDAGFVEDLAVLFGGEEAGDEGVDADVLVGPFAGEVACEVMDGGFGGGVGEDAGERIESGDGAEVDDGCGAGFIDEVLAEDLAGAEDGGEVGVDDALVFVFGDVEERSGGVGAGAVDEDVDLAGALEDGFEEVVERFARGDIDGDEVAFAAVGFDFGEAFFGFFGDAAAEDDFRAGACEADGHGSAEFAGSADDDGGFA